MEAYELNTGKMIAQLVSPGHANDCPAAIIRDHRAFAWGKNTTDAVYHATVLEEVAKMAYLTETIAGENQPLPPHIRSTHYLRKHGPKASYGQKK